MNFLRSIPIKFLLLFLYAGSDAAAQHFTAIKTDQGIEILENGKKVLVYQQQPKSQEGKYERAGYVHPLYSLNEKILTEDFPEDHPYHRGVFWAWHQILFKERPIADAWVCENILWEPGQLEIKKEKKRIAIQSEMLWKAVLNDKQPIPIIKESTIITVYKSTTQYRVIDFDISLFALVDSLKIGGSDDVKGYGGFCVRLKLPSDLSFVSNNATVTPMETAVTAGSWMDFAGSLGGDSLSKSGVAVFCSPTNPGIQHQWILRKATSMQNVPYPGRVPVTLSRKGLRLKYRVIVHSAGMSNAELEKLYQQYIQQS